jgi:signal peptidase
VEGYNTGYKTFGGYGNVIIYDRGDDKNPVIHRAILWLEYDEETKTWSAPALAKYPANLWECSGGNNPYALKGTLTLNDLDWRNSSASINLNDLAMKYPHSGYITKGDNNAVFDQPDAVSGVAGLITYEQIKSVAWIEIPWIGALKMWYNGEINTINTKVPNTIPCLIVAIISIISFAVGISFLADHIYYRRYRKRLHEEMNAPAP